MARPRLLQVLSPPLDADYVTQFQRLADLNLEIKRLGPSRTRLLHKAVLEAAVGNYAASRNAAVDAQLLAPEDAEVQYQVGVSSLLACLAQAGAVEQPLQDDLGMTIRQLLQSSAEALDKAARLNPADSDASDLNDCVAGLLERHREERNLVAALRRARGNNCREAPRAEKTSN